MRRSHRRWHRPAAGGAALVAALACGLRARAADLPPEVVASFTQRVQPLVINRCAAGACHGGAAAHAPQFQRGLPGRAPDRSHTRANLAAFLDAVGPARDARPLAALLAGGHPATAAHPAQRAAPLTTPERITLDRWLAAVREAERRSAIIDPGVVPASASEAEPAAAPPNRFRSLLDAAANPPPLPPPQEPQGVIFKNDAPPGE